jgi:leader peptidase (prepilin peptidase)/N-methyltransferase
MAADHLQAQALALIVLWFAFPVGLCWGSFLNVCIHRLPLYQSVVTPRSRCPGCGQTIAARDNIPLLSWLLLRGACRGCGARISLRYPAVELLTGLLTLLLVRQHSPMADLAATAGFASSFLFCSAVLVLIFTDYDHQILPNPVTVPGTVVGFLFSLFPGGVTWADSLIGLVLGWVAIVGVSRAYKRLRGVEGMGMGDAKMMALVGAFLGWPAVLLVLVLGSLLGSLAGVFLLATGRGGLQARLPFGTFLGIAGLVALFFGESIIGWYLGLLQ